MQTIEINCVPVDWTLNYAELHCGAESCRCLAPHTNHQRAELQQNVETPALIPTADIADLCSGSLEDCSAMFCKQQDHIFGNQESNIKRTFFFFQVKTNT